MLRCTVLRAVVGVLAVVLLVAVPNLALGQQSVSEEDAPVLDEEPIMIISEDVCDIEIVPNSVDLLLVDPLNFYAAHVVPVPCEPPLPRFKCQGCNNKPGEIYMCYYTRMDSREKCDTRLYAKFVLKAKRLLCEQSRS